MVAGEIAAVFVSVHASLKMKEVELNNYKKRLFPE
jgi:hypothetical protein